MLSHVSIASCLLASNSAWSYLFPLASSLQIKSLVWHFKCLKHLFQEVERNWNIEKQILSLQFASQFLLTHKRQPDENIFVVFTFIQIFLPNWVTNTLIYNKKVVVSPTQPYIVLWVESLSKNRNLFDIEAPGSKETVAFQAEAFGKHALYFLYECPTNVQNARPVLWWTLSKQDFVCSRCCCSNTFLETSNKKRCSTGKRCWIYSSAKITLSFPPTPASRHNCQLFPDCLTGHDILS